MPTEKEIRDQNIENGNQDLVANVDSVQANAALRQAINDVEALKTRLLQNIGGHSVVKDLVSAFNDLEEVIGDEVGLKRDKETGALVDPGFEKGKKDAADQAAKDNGTDAPKRNPDGSFKKKDEAHATSEGELTKAAGAASAAGQGSSVGGVTDPKAPTTPADNPADHKQVQNA